MVTPSTGWPQRGRWWLLIGQVACVATIGAAGRASAERPATDGQAVWLAIAVAAALISAAGNGVWLGAARRATNARRRLVAARLAASGRPGPVEAARPDGETGPVMVPGLTLRHRPGCALVAGRTVVAATADTRPCGWCSQ